MDQKVCLNLVKLNRLCAIALMNREEILRVLLKMVAMATSHSLWWFYLIPEEGWFGQPKYSTPS